MTLLNLVAPVIMRERVPEPAPEMELAPLVSGAVILAPTRMDLLEGFSAAITLLEKLKWKLWAAGERYGYHKLMSASEYLVAEQETLSREYFAEENWK